MACRHVFHSPFLWNHCVSVWESLNNGLLDLGSLLQTNRRHGALCTGGRDVVFAVIRRSPYQISFTRDLINCVLADSLQLMRVKGVELLSYATSYAGIILWT